MNWSAFMGPSYTDQTAISDAERLVNLYEETKESESGKPKRVLWGTPGLTLFKDVAAISAIGTGPIRGLFALNGHIFVSLKTAIVDLLTNATTNATYTSPSVTNDSLPVRMVANTTLTQLAILGGGDVFRIESAALAAVTMPWGSADCVMIDYLDGYFFAIEYDSVAGGGRNVYFSALNDVDSWDVLDVFAVEGSGNAIINMRAHQGQLWFFGSQSVRVYYNSGDAASPWRPRKDVVIDKGIGAKYSLESDGENLMWFDSDLRGGGSVYKMEGYQYKRVSTHAVEQLWRAYSVTSDAQAWVYTEAGHTFYVIYFVTAAKTWAYDITENKWAERSYLNGSTEEGHRGICHAAIAGLNIVGDRANGEIYTQKLGVFTDDGDTVRRERITPHVYDEDKYIYHNELKLNMATNSQVSTLEYSNDNGTTWSTAISKTSASGISRFTRLGAAKDRIYRWRCSASTRVGVLGAYLDAESGDN